MQYLPTHPLFKKLTCFNRLKEYFGRMAFQIPSTMAATAVAAAATTTTTTRRRGWRYDADAGANIDVEIDDRRRRSRTREKEKIDRQTHRWKDKISKAIISIK